MRALILNSGMGSRMGKLASGYPKCMTEILEDETIISRQLRQLRQAGIQTVVITTGKYSDVLMKYCHEINVGMDIQYIRNPDYESTNYIYSIYCARKYLEDDIFLLHGDLVMEDGILEQMISFRQSCMAVSFSAGLPEKDFKAVICDGRIREIGIDVFDRAVAAQPAYKLLWESWKPWLERIEFFCENNNRLCYAENAFNEVSDQCRLFPFNIEDRLCNEIDDYDDLQYVLKRLKATENVYEM